MLSLTDTHLAKSTKTDPFTGMRSKGTHSAAYPSSTSLGYTAQLGITSDIQLEQLNIIFDIQLQQLDITFDIQLQHLECTSECT